MALYVGHVDEARSEVRRAPASDLGDVLHAECDISEGMFDDAEATLSTCVIPRARLDEARIAFFRGHYEGCLARAVVASETRGDDLTRYRALHLAGHALTELGRYGEAEAAMRLALPGLRRLDGLRFHALARLSHAWLLASTGRERRAAVEIRAFARVAAATGHGCDARLAPSALWHLRYLVGDYAHVAAHLGHEIEHARATADANVEGWSLGLYASALLALGRVREARAVVDSMPIVAAAVGEWRTLETKLLDARADAHGCRLEALERFPALILEAEAQGVAWRVELARVWYWDALAALDPALAELRAPDLLPDESEPLYWRVRAELRAVRATPRAIYRDERGRWVLDPEATERPVRADVAGSAFRTALFLRAYQETNGHQGRMADMLGYCKQHVAARREEIGLPKPKKGPKG
jgi:hypothetical protein